MDVITHSMDMSFSKPREMVKDEEAWSAPVHGVAESGTTERLDKLADSCYCIAETNTTLQSNYPPIKDKN